MGWTSEDGGRAKVVAEHRQRREFAGGVTRETIEHHAHGTEDWFQVRVSNTDGVRTRYIYVMVWEGGWHKEMSEEMHPYYYGCPAAWLQQVPCPSSMAAEWRALVARKAADPSLTAAGISALRQMERAQRTASGKAPA